MADDPKNTIESIVNQLVDSFQIDWQQTKTLNSEEQSLLKHLVTISQVAELHRSEKTQSDTDDKNITSDNIKTQFKWGRFLIKYQIGEGGYGEVFCAYDNILDRDVALKLLKSDVNVALKTLTFIEEAKRLAKVRHPHVLAIHGANIHDGRSGFWADFIDGQSLDLQDESCPMSFSELFKICQHVAQGLEAIHQAEIIHGDIKPANIMKDNKGNYIIMDFGAGMDLDDLYEIPSYIQGSPALMAPELFAQKHTGTAIDIYAFGATLFKLASGQYPLTLKNLVSIKQAHQQGKYLKLKTLRPDLPADFVQLIQSMIAVNDEDRPNAQSIIRKLYEIEKSPQRRRKKLAIVSIIALLMIGTVLSSWGFYQANKAKVEAQLAQNKAQTVNEFLQDILKASAEFGGGRDVRVADVLDQSSEKLLSNPPIDKAIAIEMHQSLANSYNALKNSEKSLLHAKTGFSMAKEYYSAIDEAYIKSQIELIYALELSSQHQASIDLADQLIKQAEAVWGEDHRYIKQARKYKITNLMALSKFDEAIKILDQYFVEIPDPKTANNNFGFEILQARSNALAVKGHFLQAIKVAKQAIAWLAAYPHKNLMNEYSIRMVLSSAQLEQGLLDEGISTIAEALDLSVKISGKKSIRYLDTLVNLGAAQRLQGQYDAAKATTLKAYDLSKQIYGEKNNLRTIGIGTNLANMLVDLGDVDQAESVMRESLDMAYSIIGNEHAQTLILEYNLAELLNNQSRFSEALEYAISTYTKMKQTFGEKHPYVFLGLDNWAISLRGMKQYARAVSKHQEAVAGIQATMGENHPNALLVRRHEIDSLLAYGQVEVAKEKLLPLIKTMKTVLGEQDKDTIKYQAILNSL